jgi:hypothetical protein
MPTGDELKARGQEATWEKEDAEWRKTALSLLHEFATLNHRFNADDFREFTRASNLSEPHHPNVWGSLFTTAAKRFWIRKSGHYDASKNPESHAHHYVIWESSLCAPKEEIKTVNGPTIRFEMRAEGKPGFTFSTPEKARSPEWIRFYCKTMKVKSDEIKITTWTPANP